MKKIYLVEDVGNSPGRIYACFADEDDATKFALTIGNADVIERTVFYGQPPVQGFNP